MEWTDYLRIALDSATGGLMSAANVVARWVWEVANSNFSAALAGAGAGALAAQRISERSERKRKALEEIRATNAAINLAFAIANTFINMKAQHIKRFTEEYEDQRAQVLKVESQRKAGIPTAIPTFNVDFQTLDAPATPLEPLQLLLFERISLTGRPLVAFTTLTQCITGLSQAFDKRNAIIGECKTLAPNKNKLAEVYFGVADQYGRVDESYASTNTAISRQTDDCIFFSIALMEDLVAHGKDLAQPLGDRTPKIHEPSFANVEPGLIPDAAKYEKWTAAFKKAPVAVARTTLDRISDLFGSSA